MQTFSTSPARPALALAAHVAVVALMAAGCAAGTESSAAKAEPSPTPAASPSSHSTATEIPDGATIVPDAGELPEGVYRVEFTEQHLAEHGLDAEGVAGNRGVWTTTLDDGHWSVEQVAPDLTDRFQGVYQVDGDDLYWRFHDTHEVVHLTWSTDGNGDLRFTQITDTGSHPDFQFALPWARVD